MYNHPTDKASVYRTDWLYLPVVVPHTTTNPK
jgi:uncharacterized RmlC-like cupin family protein